MDFIIADKNGNEIGILEERQYIDMDIGNSNDFEIQVSQSLYKKYKIGVDYRICVSGEEYGGIIDKIQTVSTDDTVILSGKTWRGLLTQKIIEPPSGEDYRIVSGDANDIINDIICSAFDGIFRCEKKFKIDISNYKFDRYVDALSGIEKMLFEKDARIHIAYNSGEAKGTGFVEIGAVPSHDYSNEIEYSKEGTLSLLSFSYEKYTGGINHLICLGKGDLKDRMVIHLYAQADGSIGNEPFYTGKDERISIYNYSSAESAEELQKKGMNELRKLMSYEYMDMDLNNDTLSALDEKSVDVAIGDKVGGRSGDGEEYLCKRITQKIVQVKDGRESISYKVDGDMFKSASTRTPAEPEDKYQNQINVLNDDVTDLKGDMDLKMDAKDLYDFQTILEMGNAAWEQKGHVLIGRAKLTGEVKPPGSSTWNEVIIIAQNSMAGINGAKFRIMAIDQSNLVNVYYGVATSDSSGQLSLSWSRNVPTNSSGNIWFDCSSAQRLIAFTNVGPNKMTAYLVSGTPTNSSGARVFLWDETKRQSVWGYCDNDFSFKIYAKAILNGYAEMQLAPMSWLAARNSEKVFSGLTGTDTTGLYPILREKTKSGAWIAGTIGEDFYCGYVLDSRTSNGTDGFVEITSKGLLKTSDSVNIVSYGKGYYINNQCAMYSTGNQNLYFQASAENNYKLFLGVRNNSWMFGPNVNVMLTLGQPNYKWGVIYSNSATISTSDRNEKHDIMDLDGEQTRNLILGLKPKSYKLNNGESGRTHYGMIAQDLEELMGKIGMDSMDFAGFIKSPKTASVYDDEGNRISEEIIPGEYTYGLRYEEFIPPIVKVVQEQQKEINLLKEAIRELKNMLNGLLENRSE